MSPLHCAARKVKTFGDLEALTGPAGDFDLVFSTGEQLPKDMQRWMILR